MKKIFLVLTIFALSSRAFPQGTQLSVNVEPVNGSCVNGFMAKIFATAKGGVPPYSYYWNTGSPSHFISDIPDGIYTVTVTDANDYTATAEATVITSADICSGIAGTPLPQFPYEGGISPGQLYDVNFLPSHEIGFYEEYLVLDGNTLYIMEGVPFIVHDGATLVLNNCTLSANRNMWKGIVVESGATLILRNTIIRDAEYGIYAMDGSSFYIYDSQFIDNVVGIETETNHPAKFNTIDFTIFGTSFTTSAAGLKDLYPKQPPHGAKSKAGIVFNNMIGTIGNNIAAENIFSNMNCGIISNSSTLTITNNKFISILNENFYSDEFMGSGVAANGANGIFNVDVLPFVNQSAADPTFFECDYGVYGDNMSLNIKENAMAFVANGIYITRCGRNSSVNAEANNISAFNAGIKFNDNDGASQLKALNNIITTTVVGGVCIGAYESGSGINNLTVEGNNLTCAGSQLGIDINACLNSVVFNNQVTEISPGAIGFSGITLNGCSGTIVSCNSVTGLMSAAGTESYGLAARVSDNTVIHCNTFTQTNRGMAFFGPCASTNNIADNAMYEHFEGLFLNSNAILGEQQHMGNRWYGPFWSGNGANNLNSGTPADLEASMFTVHDAAGTIYYPSIPAYDNGWFIVESGVAPYSCSQISECPERSSSMSSSEDPANLDMLIASDSYLSDEYQSETRNMARQYLFNKLLLNPGLMADNADLQAFYNSYSGASIGLLQNIKDRMIGLDYYDSYFSNAIHSLEDPLNDLRDTIIVLDSLSGGDTASFAVYREIKEAFKVQASDLQNSIGVLVQQSEEIRSGDATVINTDNQNINPDEIPENNDKRINEVCLRIAETADGNLNQSEIDLVLDIAQQCPYSGGRAVYRARVLYLSVNSSMTYDDVTACLNEGIYRSSNQHSNNGIILIPNPAKEEVTVLFEFNNEGVCHLLLTDITGQLLKKIELPCDKTSYKISVSDLSSGIYFVDVVSNQSSAGRMKLAIIR
jgi:hypothetical protein